MDEIFSNAECKGILTCYSYQKKFPHRKTNQGLRALLYIGPSLWNNLDKFLKTSAALHAFKHNIRTTTFRREIENSDWFNNFTTNYLTMVSRSLLIVVTLKSFPYF